MRARVRSLLGIFVAAIAGLLLAFEGPRLVGVADQSEDRVLIFVVGDRAGVDLVRSAVDSQRIVVSTPDAIALREGRMIVAAVDDAGTPLAEAGWMDRPIEIFRLESSRYWQRSESGDREVDPERIARLRDLVNKPTLTAPEQLAVLQAMNEGIDF